MQGKILSPDTILGYNGTRYSFNKHNILNLKYNKDNNLDNIIGCLVNFKVLEDRAIEIYLINYSENIQHYQSDMDIQSVRLKAISSIVLLIASKFIPLIGNIIGLIGIVLLFLTIKRMSEISQSPYLFKNFIIYVSLNIVSKVITIILIYKISPIDDGLPNLLKSYHDNIILISLVIILPIISLILLILILREFAYLTEQKLFLYCAIAGTVVIILEIFLPRIATVFIFLAFLFYALAWFRTKEIKIYNENDKIPWF